MLVFLISKTLNKLSLITTNNETTHFVFYQEFRIIQQKIIMKNLLISITDACKSFILYIEFSIKVFPTILFIKM